MADKKRRFVKVANPNGLHLRVVACVATVASGFNARATICRGERQADAKSVLELLTLGAEQGAELTLEAVGLDAEQLLDALADYFQNDGRQLDCRVPRRRGCSEMGA